MVGFIGKIDDQTETIPTLKILVSKLTRYSRFAMTMYNSNRNGILTVMVYRFYCLQ